MTHTWLEWNSIWLYWNSVNPKVILRCCGNAEPDTWACKSGEEKFIFNREKVWEEPRAVGRGWGGGPGGSCWWLLTYDLGNLKGQEENRSLLSVARYSLVFFEVALPILPIFCVLWFLFAWRHSTFSPQWGNRYILVRVNSPQTLGRYGADCVRTANKSPPADLKWVVGRVVVNGEGEGNHERGLMNTGRIDLLTGLLSVTSAPLFSGQMLLQHFVELPQQPLAEWRGIHGDQKKVRQGNGE